MLHLNWHEVADYGTRTVATCSLLHTLLPPWDWEPEFVTVGLVDFPKAQAIIRTTFHNKYYKLLIYLVGYIALNGRSTLWAGAIGIKKQITEAVAQAQNGKG